MSRRRGAADFAAARPSTSSDFAEGFDAVTGLALAPRLAVRLRDVASQAVGPLILGTLALENREFLEQRAELLCLRALFGAADALRAALPFVHVLARTDDAELAFLVPNAGSEVDAYAEKLIRTVAGRLARDPALNFPVPLQIAFGYSQSPRDGADASLLLRLARVPKWRIGGTSPP